MAVQPWVGARQGGVGAVVAWRAADGSQRLASSGTTGVIHVWDPDRGTADTGTTFRHGIGAVHTLGIDRVHEEALASLRRLLREHDGRAVAELADLLL